VAEATETTEPESEEQEESEVKGPPKVANVG